MMSCNNCHNTPTVKNGCVRDTQRSQCNMCGDNVVRGDERHPHTTESKKAVSSLCYALGKASVGFLANLFGVSRTTTSDGIRQAASILEEPTLEADLQELDVAEMWPVSQATNDTSGFFKPWIVAPGEPWPGGSVVVMRQRSNGSTTNATLSRRVYFLQTTGTRLLRSYPKSVISLATHTRLRWNGIMPIHAIISLV